MVEEKSAVMLVNLVEVGLFSAVVESCWLVEKGVMIAAVEEEEMFEEESC